VGKNQFEAEQESTKGSRVSMRYCFTFVIFITVLLPVELNAGPDSITARKYLESGIRLIQENQIADGVRDLHTVEQSFPDSPEAPQALFFLGSYFHESNDPAKAVTLFEQLIQKYPESTFAGLADITLADSLMDTLVLKNWQAAKAKYDRVLNLFREDNLIESGRAGLADYYISTAQYEKAEVELTRIFLHRSSGSIYSKALDLYARLKVLQSQLPEAMTALQRMKSNEDSMGVNPTAVDKINLLTRLYIDKATPLKRDSSFFVNPDSMKTLDDIFLNRDKTILYLVDHKGLLTEIHLDGSAPVRRVPIPQDIDTLNRGMGSSPLLIDSDQIFLESNPLNFKGHNLKKIIDGIWTTPGEYWICNRGTKGLLRFDSQRILKEFSGKFSFKGSEVFCGSSNGGTWLLMPLLRKILYFDTSGQLARELKFQAPGYNLVQPIDIAVDDFEHLYVLDRGAHAIFVFNVALRNIAVFSLKQSEYKIRTPSGLEIGRDGSMYLADKKAKTVFRLE
jgi:tetratricopeptide (TPR) repeat protein